MGVYIHTWTGGGGGAVSTSEADVTSAPSKLVALLYETGQVKPVFRA